MVVIDNKKSKDKCLSEILSEIYIQLYKDLLSTEDGLGADLYIREAAVGTFCHGTTMTLNKVVGVTDLCLWHCQQKQWVEPYRPVSIKKLLTGSGKASKEEVNAAVQSYLDKPEEFDGDDESDAIAVAIAWLIDNGHILPQNKEVENA